jgi:hypothetical protein
MSLKSNKKFKKFPSEEGEQLDLVETINDVDELRKKRFSIILFLLLTVGLSFSFWFYRQFQTFDVKNLKMPSFSLSLSKFSPKVSENWSVFVRSIGTTDFSYSSKFNSPPDFSYITTSHEPPYAKKYLPDGVKVVEKINDNSEYLEIFSFISTPKNKFEIYTKIPGKINSDSPELDTFSKLVVTFYWHLLK